MKHVIIGSGVAGMTAALDLMKRGETEIHLYTEEPHSYYYRPQITEFLAGRLPLERVVRRSADWYAKKGIQLHLDAKVTAVQPEAKEIVLEGGAAVGYDTLLLAVGSRPFVPPIEGVDKQGVFTIRTLEDALALKAYACECRQGVVVGGGLLGLEAARGIAGLGPQVAIVELRDWLMPVQLDAEGGALLNDFVESQGFATHLGVSVRKVLGDDAITGVLLSDGRELPANLLVIAAGVRPNTQLAEAAGLDVNRGIVVDAQMRTSAPDIYAAGDAAVFEGICWAIVPTAQAQARVAAANMVSENAAYEQVSPTTALKVMNIQVNSMGNVQPKGEGYTEIRSATPETHTYKKLVLRDNKVVGAIAMNATDLARKFAKLLEEGATLNRAEAEAML